MNLIAREAKPEDDFVLILIGHGSYDGVEYKFNLPGPDISGAELASLCDRVAAKRQLIVNTTSASGGSIGALQKPGRIVIAATKTGTEKNATVFARYWVEALHDPSADTDKNEAISALEAFQYADRKTASFYESQKRLATEHAVIEDTGKNEAVRAASADNGEGLLAANFVLLRLGAAQNAANDPAKRALLEKKEDLERKIDILKYQKAAMSAEDYKKQLSGRAARSGQSTGGVGQVTRVTRSCVLCLAGLLGASISWAATPEDCHALAQARPSSRSSEMLRVAQRRARSVPPRRRLLGHGDVSRGQQPVPHRGGPVAFERHVPRPLGPPDA